MPHIPIKTKRCPAMVGIDFLIEEARVDNEHTAMRKVFAQLSIFDQVKIMKRARLSIKSTVHGFRRQIELLYMSYRYAREFLDTIVI